MPVDDLAIVLTGTIIPNAPFTAYSDPQQRRREYLEAIRFYRQFAPVYFLENSSYPLGDDAEFNAYPDVMIRQRPTSTAPQRGKGYQEFEMIDGWLMDEPQPPQRWVKITGRYFYRNFAELLKDCRCRQQASIIIDQCPLSRIARTYLFYVKSDFYRAHLASLYRECDDSAGEWIERVFYRRLAGLPKAESRMFSIEPRLTGISGTTGGSIETRQSRYLIKRILRKLNFALDNHQLWYTR